MLKCVGLGRALVSASLSALSHVAEPWTTRHSGKAKKNLTADNARTGSTHAAAPLTATRSSAPENRASCVATGALLDDADHAKLSAAGGQRPVVLDSRNGA